MLLYFSRSRKQTGNFGDELNQWLWERLMPGMWDASEAVAMSAIGTILSDAMPPAKNWIVFGSGVGYGAPPSRIDENWHIVCVRGPLTAEVLNLPEEKAVTDGAILVAAFEEFSPVQESDRLGTVFMPHHKTAETGDWAKACAEAGIGYLDPFADSVETLHRMRSAQLVIAEAMHGAILADTLRVPWMPAVCSPRINSFKWLDWTLSMELDYQPVRLSPCSVESALESARFSLQGGMVLDELSPASALEDFRRRKQGRTLVERGLNILYRGARFCLRQKIAAAWRRKQDKKWLQRSAASLAEAARRPSFLSSDDVFEQRLTEMKKRLEQVKDLAATLVDSNR